jgi:hypothetical protein
MCKTVIERLEFRDGRITRTVGGGELYGHGSGVMSPIAAIVHEVMWIGRSVSGGSGV